MPQLTTDHADRSAVARERVRERLTAAARAPATSRGRSASSRRCRAAMTRSKRTVCPRRPRAVPPAQEPWRSRGGAWPAPPRTATSRSGSSPPGRRPAGRVLLSARRVGPEGFAYGLDMTDEMLALARAHAAEAGATNVEFLRGHIETIPLPDASVDVVISNCVIPATPPRPARSAPAGHRPVSKTPRQSLLCSASLSGHTMPDDATGDARSESSGASVCCGVSACCSHDEAATEPGGGLPGLRHQRDHQPARGTSRHPACASATADADLYRFPTQHFDFHRRQLTLDRADAA